MERKEFSLFFKVNMFMTTLLFLIFLKHNNSYTILEFIILSVASISSAVILYLIIFIVLFPLSFMKNIIFYFSSFLFIAINMGLVIDFFIFRLYKFHINAMVINILTSPDAMDSIDMGIMPLIILVGVFVFFVFFVFFVLRKIQSISSENKLKLNKKLNKLLVVPLFFIIFSEKITYGLSSLFGKYELVTKFKVIPLYQPLTFSRLAAKYFDYKPNEELKNTISTTSDLNYPLKKIEYKEKIYDFNIMIVASDALRNSILSDETTPNVEEFKKESLVLNNHYSGGNATRFGVFSMWYGVNSTYWFSFLNASKGPIFFDVLKDLNYTVDIVSSTNTNWPEFRKTCYVNVQEGIKDDFDGKPWEKDRKNIDYTLEKIKNYEKDEKFFLFTFLDAPHGYSFPKEHNIFKVENENINYITATKGSQEILDAKARYKNSAHFNDALFGEIIETLKEKGIYDSTMLIFTSDHGQEFYEYGYFGHNSSFSKAQTNSPLIVKLPKNFKYAVDSNKLTSHNDIVPSILFLLGVKNPSSDFSNGYNIFDKEFHRDYIFTSNWNNNAIITNEYTSVFSNLPNKMFKNEVRDTQTYMETTAYRVDNKIVLETINENRKFLK